MQKNVKKIMNLRVCFKTYLLIRCLHVKHAFSWEEFVVCFFFFSPGDINLKTNTTQIHELCD